MIDHLKSTAVFVEVVRAGQFRAAADRLQMTPSAVSYHVRALEDAVGTPLLYRSTRRFALTDSGAKFLVHAETMLDAAKAGFSEARASDSALSGRLTVSLTTALSHSFVSQRITRFSTTYPNVELHLHYDNRPSDMVSERVDVALRIGQLRDSSLLCRHLWDMPRNLVGHPDFVAKHGPMNVPGDLRGIPWIKFTGLEERRTFIAPDGTRIETSQAGNISVNSIEAMVDLTLTGAGISSPPSHFVEGMISSGSLVECLADYKLTSLPVYTIRHRTAVPDPVVQAFLDKMFDPA
ncbi:LysR family transcriptional regulator [Aestuariicoccus sp. MJ-SS9]|uniref:LysR family transcriptional regulator n=1 Tax=Aestuariicoccus sp. MJ-SS9 TaxID=3079855 RepID=UPI002914C5FB|nr:LysR family transcriptional regulator [Aestuariicoccus sp. MJ-SS9]MDU8914211.1 LysR family transcriptional regulator [Aestuariicoccus sp. MJ-SS9]